jgi:hypothetical protein
MAEALDPEVPLVVATLLVVMEEVEVAEVKLAVVAEAKVSKDSEMVVAASVAVVVVDVEVDMVVEIVDAETAEEVAVVDSLEDLLVAVEAQSPRPSVPKLLSGQIINICRYVRVT